MSSHWSSDDVTVAPKPVRRRRRWLLITISILLLAVAGVWLLSEAKLHFEASAMRAKVVELQGRGLPTTPEELSANRPSDDQNKVIAWIEAAKLLPEASEARKSWDERDIELPLSDKEMQWAQQIQKEGQQAEPLLLEAAKRPSIYWPIDWQPLLPEYSLNFPRTLSNHAKVVAFLEHQSRNDQAALVQVERMVELAKAIESHPTLIGFLVSCGLWANASHAVQTLSIDLQVGTEAGQASPAAVRALITKLQQDQSQVQSFQNGLRGERVFVINSLLRISSGDADQTLNSLIGSAKGPDWLTTFRAKRSLWASGSFLLDSMDQVEHSAGLGDEQSGVAAATLTPAQAEELKSLAFAQIMRPSFDRAVAQVYRAQNTRRLAATCLAIRLYAIEHQGQLPKSLNELVPNYLPSVPLDSGVGNRPIQYINDPDRPILYVVGENFKDDGGREVTEGMTRKQQLATTDVVVHLKRQPRPVPKPDDDSNDE